MISLSAGGRGGRSQRGTLSSLGQSFGGYGMGGYGGGGAAGYGGGRRASRNDAADFMNKVRKRRESSADITVYRKGKESSE